MRAPSLRLGAGASSCGRQLLRRRPDGAGSRRLRRLGCAAASLPAQVAFARSAALLAERPLPELRRAACYRRHQSRPRPSGSGTVLPSRNLNLFQHARRRRGNFRVHFVRRDFEERLVALRPCRPAFFSHLVMVPSKMLSPICGITMSTAMSISCENFAQLSRAQLANALFRSAR